MNNPDCHNSFVYVLQNENHLKNALTHSHWPEKKIFITLDEFSGLNLTSLMPEGISAEVLRLSNPFSASPQHGSRLKKFFTQASSLQSVKGQLRSFFLDKKISKVVFFNDSALTKVIVQELKKKERRLYTEFWIDTLVGYREKTLQQFFWVFAEALFLQVGLIGLTPSVFGTTKLADRVLVPHEASKNVLVTRGQAIEKLFVEPTPRLKHLRKVANNWVASTPQRILVVASAWEWHGRPDVERWQDEFFAEVARFSSLNPGVAVFIRFHPRQTNTSTLLAGQRIASNISDFETDLLESSHIVSLRSSALFDAYLLQKQCFVYEVNVPRVASNEFIDSLPRLDSVRDIFALKDS